MRSGVVKVGAAKAMQLPADVDSASQPSPNPRASIPPDPEDERLTVDGLVLDGSGKVEVCAYEDLKPCFAGEAPPDQHPYPDKPGVRHGEKIPRGLKIWDDVRAGATDKDGAGWIAVRVSKDEGKKASKREVVADTQKNTLLFITCTTIWGNSLTTTISPMTTILMATGDLFNKFCVCEAR